MATVKSVTNSLQKTRTTIRNSAKKPRSLAAAYTVLGVLLWVRSALGWRVKRASVAKPKKPSELNFKLWYEDVPFNRGVNK
jgi:hypothetical protein